MKALANVLAGLVALLHVGFLIMEMFFWTATAVRENFGLTLEQATVSAPLAANQGLYNGFLAAGLLWSLLARPSDLAVRAFFLLCVIVAGIYGAATVKPSILLVQALPAALALLVSWLGRNQRHSTTIQSVK